MSHTPDVLHRLWQDPPDPNFVPRSMSDQCSLRCNYWNLNRGRNGEWRPESHPPFQSGIGWDFNFKGACRCEGDMCDVCVCVLRVISLIVIRSRNQSITNAPGVAYFGMISWCMEWKCLSEIPGMKEKKKKERKGNSKHDMHFHAVWDLGELCAVYPIQWIQWPGTSGVPLKENWLLA